MALPFAVAVGLPPAQLVPWLIAAGAVHALYQLTLTWSYSVSDFSAAFPLARGATPLFTTALGVAVLGDEPALLMVAGVLVISLGVISLVRRRAVTRIGFIAAAAAALLTTCYSLIDAKGVRLAPTPLVFVAWFFIADSVTMPAVLLMRERRNTLTALRSEWRTGIAAGLLAIGAFAPALFAFDLAPVGAVSALRECSVLIALALGGAMLKERLDRDRIIAAVLIVAGGLLIIAQSL